MKLKFNSVLITGINGYIGSRLAKRLIEENVEVYGIIRKNSNLEKIKNIQKKVHLITYNNTVKSIKDAFKNDIDLVIHLASYNTDNETTKNIERIIKSNIFLGAHILQVLINKRIPFINTSTYWTHNCGKYEPVNFYSATKQAFIDILIYYNQAYNIPALTLKLYDVYGLDDPRNKVITYLIKCAEEDKEIVLSAGEQELDLVHIDDVVNGYLIASNLLMINKEKDLAHNIYSLHTGKKYKLKKIVEIFKKYSSKNLKIKMGLIPYRKRQIFKLRYNDRKLPNWKHKTNIEEFFKNYWVNKL